MYLDESTHLEGLNNRGQGFGCLETLLRMSKKFQNSAFLLCSGVACGLIGIVVEGRIGAERRLFASEPVNCSYCFTRRACFYDDKLIS